MPGRVPQVYNPSTTVVASPAAAAETIVASFTGVNTLDASSIVQLNGQVNFTLGATAGSAQIRIRQTNVTGTVVGDTGALTGGIAAANVVSFDILGVDRPGVVAGFVYVLTLQVAGGSSVSTVSAVVFAVSVS